MHDAVTERNRDSFYIIRLVDLKKLYIIMQHSTQNRTTQWQSRAKLPLQLH